MDVNEKNERYESRNKQLLSFQGLQMNKSIDLDKIEQELKEISHGDWYNEDYRGKPGCNDWRSAGVIWSNMAEFPYNSDQVCRINCDKLHSDSEEGEIKKFEANASFIAKSPEIIAQLLEIARDAKAMAEFYKEPTNINQDWCEHTGTSYLTEHNDESLNEDFGFKAK